MFARNLTASTPYMVSPGKIGHWLHLKSCSLFRRVFATQLSPETWTRDVWRANVGNHESECHIAQCLMHSKQYGEKLNNFTAFNQRWHMPSSTSDGVLNMWYSCTVISRKTIRNQ
jgi:hypothetical protein